MKKIFFLFLILAMIVLVGCSQAPSFQGSSSGQQIGGGDGEICPCGCGDELVSCGCPTAQRILSERG